MAPFTLVHLSSVPWWGPRRPLVFPQHVSALQLFDTKRLRGAFPLVCEPDRMDVHGMKCHSQTLPLISDVCQEITYFSLWCWEFSSSSNSSQNFMEGQKPLRSSLSAALCSIPSQPQLKPFFHSAHSRFGTAGMSSRVVSFVDNLSPGGRSDQVLWCRWGHRSAAIARTESTIG